MRGPVVFLLGALIAATLGAVLVLPALEERSALRDRLSDAAGSEPRPHETAWKLAKATRELSATLGRAAEDPEGAVTRIAAQASPGSTVEWEAGSLQVTLPWEDLPRLLADLSGPDAPPFIRVTAGPAPNADSCLLTLVPEDTTAR